MDFSILFCRALSVFLSFGFCAAERTGRAILRFLMAKLAEKLGDVRAFLCLDHLFVCDSLPDLPWLPWFVLSWISGAVAGSRPGIVTVRHVFRKRIRSVEVMCVSRDHFAAERATG